MTSEMETPAHGEVSLRPSLLLPAIVAGIYFLALMLTSAQYGYFRDALYYLACSEHLAWGYVDQPPLIVFVCWVARHTLGTSLPALMLWPALAGAGRVVLTGAFARELGARKFGVGFAAVLAATPAIWYAIDHQFAMNALESLFWTGCALAMLRMIRTDNPKWWLAFGAISGLGLENKYSVAVFAFALLLGLLLTPQRKLLFTPWLLAGGGFAALIFLPNLIWNIQHHWPFLELMRKYSGVGARCGACAGAVRLAADFAYESCERHLLDYWCAVLSFCARSKGLPRVWLGFFDRLRVLSSGAREELLFGADVYRGVCRRRVGGGELFLWSASHAKSGAAHGVTNCRRGPCHSRNFSAFAAGAADIAHQQVFAVSGTVALCAATQRTQPYGHAIATALRRRIWLGRNGSGHGAGVSRPLARRANQDRDFRQQLRRSGRHRFLWTKLRLAQGHQRPSDLFLLGPALLHRRDCHRARQRESGQ